MMLIVGFLAAPAIVSVFVGSILWAFLKDASSNNKDRNKAETALHIYTPEHDETALIKRGKIRSRYYTDNANKPY